MPTLGKWKRTENGHEGSILLDGYDRPKEMRLDRNTEKDGPDYFLRLSNGAEVGAGFDKIAEKSGNAYVSVSYDNPVEGRKIDFNLIDRGNGNFDAVYSRSRGARSNENEAGDRQNENAASQDGNGSGRFAGRTAKVKRKEQEHGMER